MTYEDRNLRIAEFILDDLGIPVEVRATRASHDPRVEEQARGFGILRRTIEDAQRRRSMMAEMLVIR